MGDFGMGAGYDPDFTGDDGAAEPMDTSGYEGAETDVTDTGQDVDVQEGAIMPGETELPWDGSIAGTGSSAVSSAIALARGFSIGGPRGIQYSGGDPLPNLGTSPSVALRSQATGRTKAILGAIASRIGKHMALHAVAALVGKWGIPMVSAALGVGAEDLLFLIAQYSVRRSRRHLGPHLSTVVKRIKKADRYRHMLQKYAHKAGVTRHAAPSPYAFHRRRRKKACK